MEIEELIGRRRARVALRHGRWYSLTLRDGTVVPLQAMNYFPEWMRWQLVEGYETCPEGDPPAHLIVQPDGSLERDTDVDPSDTDRDVRAVAEGLTVFDLVPADDLARAAWASTAGHYTTCPRCSGSDRTFHHPMCQTAEGVPLFPSYSPEHWLREADEDRSPWGEIALDIVEPRRADRADDGGATP